MRAGRGDPTGCERTCGRASRVRRKVRSAMRIERAWRSRGLRCSARARGRRAGRRRRRACCRAGMDVRTCSRAGRCAFLGASDRADRVGAVLRKPGRPRLGTLHADRQIEIANRPVAGIAPALDDRVRQRPGELPLELHSRQLFPHRRLRTRAADTEQHCCRYNRRCRTIWKKPARDLIRGD